MQQALRKQSGIFSFSQTEHEEKLSDFCTSKDTIFYYILVPGLQKLKELQNVTTADGLLSGNAGTQRIRVW